MITQDEFCRELEHRLVACGDRVLLRVAIAPNFDAPLELTGPDILARAHELAAQYAPAKPRSVVLLLLPHSPELFLLHIGLILQGHVPAILAWPTSRIDPDKYQRNLVHQLSNLPAERLITLPRLAANLAASLAYDTVGCDVAGSAAFEKLFPAGAVGERLAAGEIPASDTHPGPETLFLQFSGGTTGAQKAIVVTASMLTAQLERLRRTLGFTSDDGVASWLPMYHDMGLIACLWMPLWHGAPSLHMAANDWVLNPELLLKYIACYHATFCWLPNFSFAYLSQRRERMNGTYDLSSVRGWINCSEPVRSKSMMQFADTFAGHGVRKTSLQSCYAMAETVFAITQSALEHELCMVPRSRVHHGSRSYSDLAFDLIDDVYVSSGNPLPDTEIRIVSPSGDLCAEAVPGEIHVRTPSLFSGYWGAEGFKTQTLHDGWHATGDFGFVVDGELFVIGRLKDIVIVGGQNVFPEDVEAVVNTVPGVYPGRVVAFGVEDPNYGTQSLAIVAEMSGDYDEDAGAALETTIRQLVLAAAGIAPRYVAVMQQRWIVKSTAGKISRRETRERFLRERLGVAAMEIA